VQSLVDAKLPAGGGSPKSCKRYASAGIGNPAWELAVTGKQIEDQC
jgi:hypothetical protein